MHRTIDVAIVTVSRKEKYIYELLRRLRVGAPVRLVVGSADVEYLAPFKGYPQLKVISAPRSEWKRVKGSSTHHKATWNYWRALTVGVSTAGREGLLLLEDDVVPSDNLEPQLHKIIDWLEVLYGINYALSLYYPHQFTPADASGLYVEYPTHRFFGTQAIYYPERLRQGFAEFLRVNGVELNRTAYDLLLREYLVQNRVPLFGSFPCLVQHIGRIGTGLGAFHEARIVAEDLAVRT
jgi:hypothetical protein